MGNTRLIENCRCYHLIGRLAHRAFFLGDEEKARAVELLRREEAFSGVIVLAYAIMSNRFHIFIYVPEPEEIDDDEFLQSYALELDLGNPRIAERILELLADGPMRPSALRKAVGMRNCTHFNRYYLAPMMEKGIVARTESAHPQSPQQKYRLA